MELQEHRECKGALEVQVSLDLKDRMVPQASLVLQVPEVLLE